MPRCWAATLGVHGLALGRYGAGPRATTLAFSTLTSAQLLHALVYRSRGAASSTGAPSPLLGGVVAGSLAFQASTLLVPPLRRLLGLTVPSAGDWALIAAGAAAPCSSMRSGGYSGRPPRHRPEGPVP